MIYQPPNLANLGLPRAVPAPTADIITVWKTTYPVLTRYKLLCQDLRIVPFAGGSYLEQGPRRNVGYITSGYRDIGERNNSPHKFGLAIDIAVGNLDQQIIWGRRALYYFYRVGIYPDRGIIHIDLCNEDWMNKYNGKPSWVCRNGIYTSFDNLEESIKYAQAA